jgi:predicted GTPase
MGRARRKRNEHDLSFEDDLRQSMKFLDWAPMVTISAFTGQRVTNILPLVVKANEARNLRIPTSKLNRFFEDNVSQPRGGTAPSANKGGGSRLKVQFLRRADCARRFLFYLRPAADKAKRDFIFRI